jgi:type IX secretion system PorP/SprF family membrane protein
MIRILILFAFGFLTFGKLNAQDLLFLNGSNHLLYINPAYTGTVKEFSIATNYKNQWRNFNLLTIQANQFLGKGNGVGLSYNMDYSRPVFSKNEIALSYGKTVSLNERNHISMGVQTTFFRNKINIDGIITPDGTDPMDDPVLASLRPKSNVDFNAGVLFYNRFMYAGFSTKHILRPNESVNPDKTFRIPLLLSTQLGFKIKSGELSVSPSIIAYYSDLSYAKSYPFIAMLAVRYSSIELHGGYSHYNGLVAGLKYHFDNFNFGYTYGKSNFMFGHSHEVFAAFNFKTFNKTNEYFFDF